jgi:integrase
MLFRILVDSQKWIFEWLKKDKSPKNNIYSLTLRELQYLFNGMLCGDGTRQKSRCLEYRGQEIEHILLLQTISSLLGYRTQLSKCNKGYHRLYICKRNKIQFTTLKDRLTEVEYNGIVWCPRTINHTFLAKRNNSIFITGNSGAREMLRKGIPIAVVSKILGHASLTTTMIYADENESGRREIYQSKMK